MDRIHESSNQGVEMGVAPLTIIPSNQLPISFGKCTVSLDNIHHYKENLLERSLDFLFENGTWRNNH